MSKSKTYLICNNCNKSFYSGHKNSKFCSKDCYYKSKINKIAVPSRYKGGKYTNTQGYILIKLPEHKNSNSDGYIREHIIVMEKNIGRYLNNEEIIHHKNGNKSDNRIENLLLTTKSEHRKIHSIYKQDIKDKIFEELNINWNISRVSKLFNITRNSIYRFISQK